MKKPTYEELEQKIKDLGKKLAEKDIGRCGLSKESVDEALEESEKKFRIMMEAMVNGVYICSPDFKIEYMNPVMIKMLGYNAVGETCYRAIHNLEHKCTWCVYDKVRQGESVEAEVINPKDNHNYHVTSMPIFKKNGSVSKMTIYRDITDKKLAEDERRRLAAVVEQTSESVIIANGRGEIQYVNSAFEQISGFTKKEIIGKNFRIFKSDKHDDSFYKNMYDIISGGNTWSGRITNRMKDGKLVEFDTRISPIRDGSGAIVNYVSVNHNVTQQVALESQLRQAIKMQAVGTLAGGVAHDFNNLLTTILGYAGFAKNRLKKDSDLYDEIEEIRKAGEKAAALTRQLLAFSRKQIIQPKVLLINKIVGEMQKMLKRLIREDVEIKTVLDPELFPVKLDPGQFEQVIMNLVVNARDAMPTGGHLTIETANMELDIDYFRDRGVEEKPGDYVMVAVTDTGAGMNEQIQSRIFEPFFTTKERGHGTGLGLSTVYGIVKQNDGHIWVYSEPGKGTTFKVYFPRVDAGLFHDSKEYFDEKMNKGYETILLVEDNASLLKMTKKMLTNYGYQVLTAKNGEEALEISGMHEGPIHLVLTDVVMPIMGGVNLVEQIRIKRPEIKVIYMSGYTDNSIAHYGILDKDLEFLQKPFTSKDLGRKIKKVLKQKP